MGRSRLDERGRILVPAEHRERLALTAGSEVELVEEKGTLVVRRVLPPPLKIRSRKRSWGSEAFADAGEATFGA